MTIKRKKDDVTESGWLLKINLDGPQYWEQKVLVHHKLERDLRVVHSISFNKRSFSLDGSKPKESKPPFLSR